MRNYDAMEQYWIWLATIPGIGPKKFYRLIGIYEDARAVWDNVGDPEMAFLGEQTLAKLKKARSEQYFYRLFNRLEQLDVDVITRLSDDYPPLLNTIFDPPAVLYVRGAEALRAERAFAIVGSRRATRDGKRAAREIAEGLSRNGVTVVSGLARGVDTAAHEGAVKAEGPTVAVLGCGVDIVYPPENDQLAQRILETGGALVSEYPPGTRPLAGHFPARNRIISGMSAGTLLVEGAQGSGAMITMDFAAEQGRDAFAVPGSIYSPQSSMPNKLIVDGATPVLSHWEILEYYRWAERPAANAEKAPKVELDEEEARIVEPLRNEEMSFDELIAATGILPAKLNSHLTILELRGIIVKAPGGLYRAYQ